ncbi:MAG TPA: hypothetical protein VGL68_02475 [Solirubrobacteraceae bacterium]|jgi:hypothetical protein
MKLKVLVVFVCLLTLGLSNTAQGRISSIQYKPHPLYTDDPSIAVSWTADRDLKRGYIYEAEIEISSLKEGSCRSSENSWSQGAPKRGKLVHIDLITNNMEWCNGRVVIHVGYTKNGTICRTEMILEPEEKEEVGLYEESTTAPKEVLKPRQICEPYPFHQIFEGEFRISKKP